jgi:hypothetical protein
MVRYPHIKVTLSGTDGNVFALMGKVRIAMRRARVPQPQIEEFTENVLACDGYDDALRIMLETVYIQ